eukprot:2418773-Amphidinium_carterae.1
MGGNTDTIALEGPDEPSPKVSHLLPCLKPHGDQNLYPDPPKSPKTSSAPSDSNSSHLELKSKHARD